MTTVTKISSAAQMILTSQRFNGYRSTGYRKRALEDPFHTDDNRFDHHCSPADTLGRAP
jgi:hypothetical protein